MRALDSKQLVVVALAFFLPILLYLYYNRKPTKSSAGPLPPPTEITDIFIHPIKSCHYLTVKSAKLLPTGLDLGTASFTLSLSI